METDKKLIEEAKKGHSEAFEALYYRYRDWVFRLAWRFTGNQEQALDVLQETFLYLLKKLPELELKAQMTTFLYPVVKHTSVNIRRKANQHQSAETITNEIVAPAETKTSGQFSELAAVLAVLDEKHREVLLMRFVDDMSIEQIATALNIPNGTVKSRLHNGLKILRGNPQTKKYFFE